MQDKFDWSDAEVFVVFARVQSMAETARVLAQDETTVSRRIKRLGVALGASLTESRNGRVALSEAGLALVPAAEAMAEAAIAITRTADEAARGPTGIVRVTAIRAVLGRLIIPELSRLAARSPGLSLHLIGDTRNLNLSRRESDIAIRLAMPTSSEITTRKLADIAFCVYAHREQYRPDMPWVTYSEELGQLPEGQWAERKRAGFRVSTAANSVELLTGLTLSGAGVAVLPCFVGDCEPLLMRIEPKPVVMREAWLAVHREDRRSPRIRTTMDFITAIFEEKSELLAGRVPRLTHV
jgi:DNA-binding transcriptional LysR family regulator